MNSFYSAIWESIFLLYINNWTTNEISKNFLTVVHIIIHNVGNKMVTYTEAWNVAFKTPKSLWKMWKYNINIFYKTNLKAERNAGSTW